MAAWRAVGRRVLVAWDLFGTLPLAVGVAGHELSTVLVCLNGLRLLGRPGWPAPATPATAARSALALARS